MTLQLLQPEIIRENGAIFGKYIGDMMKALANGKFEGRGIRWHDPDRKDLQGEWFSQKTYTMRNAGYPVAGIPVNYQHGLHKDFGNLAIGLVRFADEDEFGLFIEGELKTREEYIEMLKEIGRKADVKFTDNQLATKSALMVKEVGKLVTSVPMQFSGGFDPSTWIVDPNTRHIDQAGMIHLAFTPTPADDLNPTVRFKSALQEVLKYEPSTVYSLPSQLTDSPTVPKDATEHKAVDGASADNEPAQANVHIVKTTPKTGAKHKMTIKAIKNRYRQTVRQELDAMVEQELSAIVEQIAAEIGADVAPEDADAIAEGVTADIEQAVEATADDDAMMMVDGEELDEEEKRKAVRGIIMKHFYTVAYAKAYKHFGDKKAQVEKVKADAQAQARNEYLKAQPATSKLPAYTGGGNGHEPHVNTRKWGQLTVSEMRAYADLSAEEMALVGKLAKTKAPEYDRKALTMGSFVERGILSEEFVKTLAHKAASQLDGWQVNNPQDVIAINDHATMKAVNWLKADELGATDITNQGAEWVELFYDTQAWRRVRDETRLYDLMVSKGMRVKDIPTGVKGMNVKLVDGNGTAYTLQEGGSVDATGRPQVVTNPSFITTNEVEENLATHIIAEGFTFQLAERSMINVAQELNEDIITTLAESLEDTILNGDKTTGASSNINLIDGTPGTGLSTPAYIAWDGVRHHVLVDNTSYGIDNANAALAAVDYERVRALWPLRVRRRKDKILFVIDEGVETQTRRLAEHFTVGVAGESNATFFTGDLNVLVGFDVYASGFLGLSNGDGKISATGSNNTQGQIYGIFCEYWQYGRQLAINIEEDRFALSQSSVFVATVNHLLKPRSAFASVGMYDIDV